jgi:hypothetical protein
VGQSGKITHNLSELAFKIIYINNVLTLPHVIDMLDSMYTLEYEFSRSFQQIR